MWLIVLYDYNSYRYQSLRQTEAQTTDELYFKFTS